MLERVIERIECFVGWNAEADRLVDRVVAEIDARAVVALVPEERDLEAAADAPGELPAGLVGESCRADDRCLRGLVFGCRRSRGGSAGDWVRKSARDREALADDVGNRLLATGDERRGGAVDRIDGQPGLDVLAEEAGHADDP